LDRTRITLSALAAAALVATGCEDAARAIDPFPIRFDDSQGMVLVGADIGQGPMPAVLDTLAPVTLIDPLAVGGSAEVARRRRVEVTLLGIDQTGSATVPRARFPDTSAIELHPCPGDSLCQVGAGASVVEFGTLLGTDILGRASLRIDFAARELRFFPEMAGTEADLTSDCQAVFSSAFAGGGTILVGGTEVPYSGRRAVVGACLDQEDAPTDSERGTDTLFAISTGTGVSLLSASAYDRYAAATGAPARDLLVAGELYLSSGPTKVLFAEIGRAALVGSLSDETGQRGPCRELYLNRLMSVNACNQGLVGTCPCPDGDDFCRTAAAVDLAGPIAVAIVPDDHPLLQSLRDELRPERPELDGILGAGALGRLRIELDYPNGRMAARCRVPIGCTTLPAVRSEDSLDDLERCRSEDLALPDAGPVVGIDGGAADGGAPDAGPGAPDAAAALAW
jgi:hypothetical protein